MSAPAEAPGTGAAAEPVVTVIDDDPAVRAALADLLASVGWQARTFASTAEFLAQPLPDAPSCLILDVRMPGQSGLDLQEQLTRLGARIPIIFITGHGDVAMSVKAMKGGAIEFLTKPFRDQDLLDAIQHGIDRDRARRAEDAVTAELRTRWDSLSRGEREVMTLVVRGLLNKQIAAELDVSEITVKVRRSQVMRKMQAGSLADLVRIADRIARTTGG